MMQRLVVAVCGFVLSAFAAVSAGAQSFTIQQVLSAPFSSGLQAAPAGGRFLWIANQQGKRNIWVAEASGSAYTVHRVTNDDADDGIDVGDIAWTPDGEHIVYVRGGDFEFPEKPSPNPAMLPQGIEQDIWIVGVHGGDARKLAQGREPAVAPDGNTIAFLSSDQIWTLDLRDANAKPVQLFHGRGGLGSLEWSPDGKYLAFASRRGDHGFVGVYSFADQSLKYLDPSTEIDREPVWSPDSRAIAFVRIPPDTSGVDFKPRRSAQPWSIVVADVATGDGRVVWHAHEGQGSVFHETESEKQLFWSAGNHVVFPWEGNGWVHLYSVATSGGDATELTPGNFEVDYVAFSKDRKTLVYSSNQDDIDRRHLWQVAADGGSPKELTHGEGLEIIPVVGPDGTVAVLRSDVHVPIRPAVVGRGGELTDLAPQMVPA
ncbi:MAG: DPP IV N-terminal domain-containing protein, partial [Acidobacteriaceae bacterium]